MFGRSRILCVLGLWAAWCGTCLGQGDWVIPSRHWETIGPPSGVLLVHGGGDLDAVVKNFLSLVDDPEALVVVIPTAGPDAACGHDGPAAKLLREKGAKNVKVLHTRRRKEANTAQFAAPLREAKGVWISGGQQGRLAKAYLHTLVHRELFDVLRRGGVVGGSSAGASIQGSFLYGGRSGGDLGFGFIRDSAIGQHYVRRQRLGGLARIVGQRTELLGIGIDEDTFIVVRGDAFRVEGSSKVLVCNPRREGWRVDQPYEHLFAGDTYDLRRREVRPDQCRAAIDPSARTEKRQVDPAAYWRTHGPPKGTLLLAGAKPGTTIARRFLKLSGGGDARIVVIPTADGSHRDESHKDVHMLRALGAKNVELWHTIDRGEANSPEFVAPLRTADAVWICDGDQWRLADAYLDTLAHEELLKLLDRGGVIGASGAAARFLAVRMADDPYGWNRGCGLLAKTAVDTWPGGERRIQGMTTILKENQQLLGIGIDEQAAILVRGDVFEVLGAGNVAVFDPSRPGWPWEDDDESYVLLGEGERFDMKSRQADWQKPRDPGTRASRLGERGPVPE